MAQQPRAQLSQGTLPMQELPGPSSQVLNASLTCRLRGDTEGAGNPKTRTHFPKENTTSGSCQAESKEADATDTSTNLKEGDFLS